MKAAPFAYVRATSRREALDALARAGDGARVIAGGQSLVPLLAMRLSRPDVLVDIGTAPDLDTLEVAGGVVRVGAATTDRAVERDDAVGRRHPLLMATLAHVGHVEIRNRGTVCGSLAHADPAAELPALLVATDGEVLVDGPAGPRTIAAADLYTGPFETSLVEGELICEARFPLPADGAGWAVREVARRHGDFALVGVVVVLEVDASARCTSARVGLFGVAATPVRAHAAERALVGTRLEDDDLAAAAASAFDGVAVIGDIHGSVGYRRSAGSALVGRALQEARSRLAGREGDGR